MGRSILKRLAVLLLAFAPVIAADEPPTFPVRMVKLGGSFERADVRAHLEFCAERGFNAVWVYSGLAGRWKERSAPDGPFLHPSFLDLARWCHDHDWRIFVSVNPVADSGGRFVFSNPEGARRIRKFLGLLRRQAGVRDFVLSFDDQPTELLELSDVLAYGRSSAPAHLDLARQVARAVPRKGSYWLCAAAYCDRHLGDGSGPYTSAFLEGLDALPSRTGIVWTGPRVLSPSITADDLEATRRRLGGRELLLYDNYPSMWNPDGSSLAMILGPLRGRDARLQDQTSVYLSCPMRSLGGSRLALATIADYLATPDTYDPDSAWKAIKETLTAGDPQALRALDTQGLEWGGWIGTRNYRFEDTVYTAVEALDDPAAMVRWSYVVQRYPERIEALAGVSDPLFREPLIERMKARLAVGRAMELVAELRSAPPERQEAILGRLAALRAETRGRTEASRSLDLFLEAVGVSFPEPAPDAVAP